MSEKPVCAVIPSWKRTKARIEMANMVLAYSKDKLCKVSKFDDR